MEKLYVPITAIRHSFVIVDADTAQAALTQGCEAIKAGNFQYLKIPVFTVVEPVENVVKEK